MERSASGGQTARPPPPSAFDPHRNLFTPLQQQQQHQHGNGPNISRRRSSLERGNYNKRPVAAQTPPPGASHHIKASGSSASISPASAVPSMTFSQSRSSIRSLQAGGDHDEDTDHDGFFTPPPGHSPVRVHAMSSSRDLLSPETAMSVFSQDENYSDANESVRIGSGGGGGGGFYQRMRNAASASNLGKQMGWQSRDSVTAIGHDAAEQGDQDTFLPNFDDDSDEDNRVRSGRAPARSPGPSPIGEGTKSAIVPRQKNKPASHKVKATDYGRFRTAEERASMDLQQRREAERAQRDAAGHGQSQHPPQQRPSRSTLRGLYSNLLKKADDEGQKPDESLWERERRLDEKRQAEEAKKKKAEEKAKELMAEFSLEKKKPVKKDKGKGKEGTGSSSSLDSSREATLASPDSPKRRLAEAEYQANFSPNRARSGSDTSAFSSVSEQRNRQGRRPKTSSVGVHSGSNAYENRRRALSSTAFDDSFIRMGSETSSNTSHSREASDVSSAASRSIRWEDADSSFLPISTATLYTKGKRSGSQLSGKPNEQRSNRKPLPSIMMHRPASPTPSEKFLQREAENALGLSNKSHAPSSGEALSLSQVSSESDHQTPVRQQEQDEEYNDHHHPFALDANASGTALGVSGQIRSSPVQVQLSSLPPLTTMVDDCLSMAWHTSGDDPWQGVKAKPLTASSSKDVVPKSWASYIKAYSRGELDLSNPPAPRSAPLVKRARPRASPNPNAGTPSFSSPSPSARPLNHQSSNNSIASAFELPTATNKGIGLDFGTSKSRDRDVGSRATLRSPSCDALFSYSPSSSPTSWMPTPSTATKGTSPRFATASPKSPKFNLRKTKSREMLRMPEEDVEEIRTQAEEISAVGGMGDIRAPRPAWEAKRNHAAKELLDAYRRESHQGGGHNASFTSRRPNARLEAIVERLAVSMGCSYAGVQLLLSDEAIVLASSGLDEGARASLEVFSTPRIDSFGEADQAFRPTDSLLKGQKLWRDRTLDAHTILCRNATPLVIEDLSQDWRFDAREAADIRFYAGVSVLSSNGLPVGTVSVTDARSKKDSFSKDARDKLAEAAREVAKELQRLQRQAMVATLAHLDESLARWTGLPNGMNVQASPSDTAARGIEAVLEKSNGSNNHLLAVSSLAQRRGARVPTTLNVPASPAVDFGFDRDDNLTPTSQSALEARLSSALTTIVRSVPNIDLAYVARVCSHPLDCHVITSRQSGMFGTGCDNELELDAEMHLCALAASKVGLRFDREADKVARLLGLDLAKQQELPTKAEHTKGILVDSASATTSEDEEHHHQHVLGPAAAQDTALVRPLQSAVVVGCGLKEGGRAHRGTEGWVLSVASRSSDPLGPEVNLYLLRFATLLASLLLESPQSPATPKRSLTPINTRPSFPPRSTSPIVRSSRNGKYIHGGPASPPPNAPLPLLPVSPSKMNAPLPSPPLTAALPATSDGASASSKQPSPLRQRSSTNVSNASSSRGSSASTNDDLEIIESEDGHANFSFLRIGKGMSQEAVVRA